MTAGDRHDDGKALPTAVPIDPEGRRDRDDAGDAGDTLDPPDPVDLAWMDRALALAREAELAGDVPVGCVVVNGAGLVAEGFNTREAKADPLGHAEIVALSGAARALSRWRLSDCTVYVTLEPCFMCAGALVHARVKRVVYATTDPKAGAAGSLANVLQDERLNHRCELSRGPREAEASALLKAFFRSRRR